MNSPSFDLSIEPSSQPAPERRNYVGWVLLLVIFSFLIGKELHEYLGRDEQQPASKYSNQAAQLKMAIEMRSTLSSLGPMGSQNALEAVHTVEKDLEKDAAKDEIAARIYAAARSEQGKDIPESVMGQLKSSEEPRDKLFAEVFAAKELTPERAVEIESELKGGGFISKLAVVQAYEKAGDSSRREALVSKGRGYAKIGVMLGAVLAGGIGFILLVLFPILKATGHLPRQGLPLERISLADADRLAIRTAQIIAIFLAVPLCLEVVMATGGKRLDPHLSTLLTYLLLIFSVLYVFRMPINGRTFTLESIGISKRNLGRNVLWGVGTALANLPLVLIMALIGNWVFAGLPKPEHPITTEISTGAVGPFGIAVLLFAASVGAPIIEEIMFRGTLLPALARVWRAPVLAILAQGLIFAAIHPTGVAAWFALGTIGAMSGFLSRETGSLVPSIVMHAVHNFGTMMIATTLFG